MTFYVFLHNISVLITIRYAICALPAEVHSQQFRCQGSRGRMWSRLRQHRESRQRP